MARAQIGLFGGTFDPPHLGHLILASEAAHQFKLTRVLWMLAPDPPHKLEQPITPLPHRLEMLKRTVADNPIFEISDLEINRPGPHYTIDTVRILAERESNADIILLIGGDSLRDLPKWRDAPALVSEVKKIGVMRRPDDSLDMRALEAQIRGVTKKVKFIDAPLQELSSHEIRRRIAEGGEYRYYLFPAAYEYIEKNNLYR
ncbi:MAG: nicotinate-nucleotide adenylyltransferase [Anaerolineales bacterium]|nr:nicotinate-nucleotide adenylyltransferase [Anaerolineales bacterium]